MKRLSRSLCTGRHDKVSTCRRTCFRCVLVGDQCSARAPQIALHRQLCTGRTAPAGLHRQD